MTGPATSARAEAVLAALLESTTDAIITYDLNGLISGWNPAAERLLGFSVHEVLGESISRLTHPGTSDQTAQLLARTGRGERLQERHVVLRRKDGNSVHVLLSVAPVLGSAGEVTAGLSVVRDITQEKRAEREVKEVREQMARVLEQMPAAVILAEAPSGKVLFSNRLVRDVLGREIPDPSDVEGYDVYGGVHADGRDFLVEDWPLARALRNGETIRGEEIDFERGDGTRGTLSASAAPLRDSTGRIFAAVVAFDDITERRQTEAALRSSEQRYRLALRATNDALWDWDLTTDHVVWNDAVQTLFGYSADAVHSSPDWWVQRIHPEDRPHTLKNINEVINGTGEHWTSEYRFRRADGNYARVLDRGYMLRDADHRPLRIVGSMLDLTGRRRTERRDAFLVMLDDNIRPLTDPDQITQRAARLLGEHLSVNRCAYADVEADQDTFNLTGDYNFGVPSIVGRYTFTDFGAECLRLMRAGQPYVVEDSELDPRTEQVRESYRLTLIRSVICVSLVKGGRFIAAMAVHQTTPRTWLPDEVELVQQVAGRCWESIERARVSRELRESEARFRDMADSAPVLIWIADATKLCTWFNKPWLEFTGRTLAEEYGAGWAEGVHPDDMERCLATYHGAFDRRESFKMDYRLRNHAGEWRWVLDNGIPRFSSEGAFLGYIGSCFDITERKYAEQSLRESEARFRELANAVPALVWVTTPGGEVSYFNNQWYAYTGLLPEQSLGMEWAKVIHPDDAEPTLQVWQRAREAESLYEVECRYRRANGDYRWFMARALPVRDAAGNIAQWFGTSTDIHESKRSEAELRRANSDLEQFAYSASHDLREPLRMVAIYSQLLQRKYGGRLDSQADEYLEFTVKGAKRMETLVADLLKYTQAVNFSDEKVSPVDGDAALTAALSNLTSAIEESGCTISRAPMPKLLVQQVHLLLLFQNIVGNAIKYRAEDPPLVRISAQRHGLMWCLCVEDNGIGISPQYAEQVFGLFKRLHNSDSYSGTGIGLAICQKIVERYGGRIWVEAAVGRGSRFCFTLPGAE